MLSSSSSSTVPAFLAAPSQYWESISIISLLTGDNYSHLKTRNNLKNTIPVENLLNSLGICATTEAKNIYGKYVKANTHIVEVLGDDSTFDLFKKSINNSPLAIYQSTLQEKLEYLCVNDKIKKGERTIIYTQFTNGIV